MSLESRTAAAVAGEEDADLKLVDLRLGRWRAGWGFVLHLTTVRYLGVFLDDPTDVPVRVLDYLVEELQIRIPALAGRYSAGHDAVRASVGDLRGRWRARLRRGPRPS